MTARLNYLFEFPAIFIKTHIRLTTAERLTLVVEGNNLQAVLMTAGAGTQN